MEIMMSRVGKPLKKLSLIYKQTTSNELVEYMKPKLQGFVKHNFVARWQDKHFKICLKSFLVGNMVSIVDFVENYSFEVQMNFNPCIGTHFNLIFLCISHLGTILMQILMMNLFAF
jgi:hypothetical protein